MEKIYTLSGSSNPIPNKEYNKYERKISSCHETETKLNNSSDAQKPTSEMNNEKEGQERELGLTLAEMVQAKMDRSQINNILMSKEWYEMIVSILEN